MVRLTVNKAFEFLNYDNKASQLILKVLESAVANAEHNNSSDLDDLIVKNVLIDEGRLEKGIDQELEVGLIKF